MQVEQKIYLPGQIVTQLSEGTKYDGSTLCKDKKDNLIALFPGILNRDLIINSEQEKQGLSIKPKKQDLPLMLLTNTVTYSPKKGDFVIGIIKARLQETYLVDINASNDAILGQLEFDNSTKKNKPNLTNGTAIYCRVLEVSKYLGAKLSCIGKGFTSKNSNQLGQLKKGTILQVTVNEHPKIQKKLTLIAKYLAFQIAFGKNGIVWICQSGSNIEMLAILSNCIKAVQQNMPDEAIQIICKTVNKGV